jgi:excisionase family DNA binding protein
MSNQNEGDGMQNELMTVQEVADYLRVSRVTAWRWCQEGIIPAFRIGRIWRIRRDKLLELEEVTDSDHRGSHAEEPRDSNPPRSEDSSVVLNHKQRTDLVDVTEDRV